MTMPAFAESLGDRLPHAGERSVANQLRKIIAGNNKLRFQGQTAEIVLTPAIKDVLLEVLRHISSGDAVTIVPVSQMLTTQQAADILNVSRPFLISILGKGEIPFELVGRHRRIKAEHLFDFKKARDARRDQALSDLAELDADLL